VDVSQFLPAAFCFLLSASLFAVVFYRWRNPDGHPTGYIAWAEQRFTVGRFQRRPLPPWWFGLPLSAVMMVVSVAGMIFSLR
jgi:hypothetical protein